MEARINLNLFASLRSYLPENPAEFPITPGTTIRQIATRLGIPLKEAKLIFVNGVRAGLDHRLEGGERVGIFPPVGGG